MTLAFTVCSINYISQAKALADSLKETNSEIIFYIGLVDRLKDIPVEFAKSFEPYNIIEVEKIGIPNFDWMNENYDIVELNTAVKPFYFKYFFEQVSKANKFIFLDPDIIVYKPLSLIENNLEKYNIILTPSLTQAIEDDRNKYYIHESHILNHGIFNLGFLAINNSKTSFSFIDWWADRLLEQCKHDLCNGLFVDQLWCNLVPAYFDKVLIEKHLGMNMAYWNLQERTISKNKDSYFVNKDFELIFFHFSTFNPDIPNNIAAKQNRFTMSDRPDLKELYENYEEIVRENHFEELKRLNCIFGRKPKPIKRLKRVRAFVTKPLKWLIKFVEEIV